MEGMEWLWLFPFDSTLELQAGFRYFVLSLASSCILGTPQGKAFRHSMSFKPGKSRQWWDSPAMCLSPVKIFRIFPGLTLSCNNGQLWHLESFCWRTFRREGWWGLSKHTWNYPFWLRRLGWLPKDRHALLFWLYTLQYQNFRLL